MLLHFKKYQATGNDFIIADNRDGKITLTVEQIRRACDRRFGIGADGLILIEKDGTTDFNMVYYNSDGSQSLCGNGSRAAVLMASSLGLVNGAASFSAYDGLHRATLQPDNVVSVQMNNVTEWKTFAEDIFLNTGSPHYIRFVKDLKNYPVVAEGRKIRYSDTFKPGGTNVNFVELLDNNCIFVRTYERGVEDETLSCGTGVTAAALAVAFKGYSSPVAIRVVGGDLTVTYKFSHSSPKNVPSIGQAGTFEEISLTGPAKMVFEGTLEL